MRNYISTSLLLLAYLVIAGCNQDVYAEKCTRIIEEIIRSPSTLRVVKLESYKNGQPSVFIDFDAANAYGTMVRSHAYCKFEAKIVGKEVVPTDKPNFVEVTIGDTTLTEEELAIYNISIDMDMRE